MKNFYSFLLLFLSCMMGYAQWTQVPSTPTGYINDIVVSQETIYLAHGSQGVYRSDDNALTWELLNQGLNNTQAKNVNQLLVLGDTLFAATTDGIYRSVDNGNNWVKKSNGIQVGGGAIYAFTLSVYNHNGVLLTGAFTGIYRSADMGENWEITNISGSHVYPQVFVNHNGILFGARESINTPYGYQSTDDGLNWTEMTINIPTICFLSEPGKLWSGTIGGVWLSEDNGVSWQERNNGLPPDPYSAGLLRIGNQLISSLKFGGSGMYHSFDEGMNWEDFGEGLGFFTIISKLVLYENRILVATSNGVWERELETTSNTGSAFEESGRVLSQNYPNPFAENTIIRFRVREAGLVELAVFNDKGTLIRTLEDQTMEAGSYEYLWDGNGPNGQPAAPGFYFYRLLANDGMETGRMVKVK